MRVENYEFLERIAQDEERESFKARDLSNHHEVIVHVLRPQSDSLKLKPELMELARPLFSQPYPTGLLSAGEIEGTFYIVTDSRAECLEIRKWLETQSAMKSISKSSDGKFNRPGVWKVPSELAPETETPGVPRPVQRNSGSNPAHDGSIESSSPDSSLHPEPAAPGAFTRMFSVHVSPNEHPGEPGPQQKRPVEPGEFTRMFQARSDGDKAGESQRTSLPKLNSPVESKPTSPSPTDANTSPEGLRETSVLEKQSKDQRQAPPISSESRGSGPGEFTRMFEVKPNSDPVSRTSPAPFQDSIYPEVSHPPASSDSGAGNFTQMFRTTPVPEERKPEQWKPTLESGTYKKDDIRQTSLPPVSPPDWKQPDLLPTRDASRTSSQNSRNPYPSHSTNEAATEIFKVYVPDEKDATYKQTSGPSEYTQMFSVPGVTPPATPAPPVSEISQPPVAASPVKVELSQPPIAPPQFKPDVPQPQIATPPLNNAVAPAQPAAPQLPPAEMPTWHSYLPLILIMNVVFLAAVFLIIYFVLKK
jgi:hypothetical protein